LTSAVLEPAPAAGTDDPELGTVRQGSLAVRDALLRARIDFVVHLPDSVLWQVPPLLGRMGVATYVCAREDEGVAMAAGAWLAGRRSVILMEGSGLGLSGLILARCQIQRTPMLVVASHTLALGEAFDYHAATRLAGMGTLSGLNIPAVIVHDPRLLGPSVEQAAVTVQGQRSIVGVLVPEFVMDPLP
jgi:sulfopyruvate decarboxylase TPP-binding subunit